MADGYNQGMASNNHTSSKDTTMTMTARGSDDYIEVKDAVESLAFSDVPEVSDSDMRCFDHDDSDSGQRIRMIWNVSDERWKLIAFDDVGHTSWTTEFSSRTPVAAITMAAKVATEIDYTS